MALRQARCNGEVGLEPEGLQIEPGGESGQRQEGLRFAAAHHSLISQEVNLEAAMTRRALNKRQQRRTRPMVT